MAASLEELCLIDAEDNKDYKIFVSSEDVKKAKKGKNVITNFDILINMNIIFTSFTDMRFATELLEEAEKRNASQAINERKYHYKCRYIINKIINLCLMILCYSKYQWY